VIDEDKKYLMESLINNILNQGELSNHVSVSINKNSDKYGVIFNYDSLEEEYRDSFFSFIQKSMYNTLVNGVKTTGKYEGIFDAFDKMDHISGRTFDINSQGLSIKDSRHFYFKFVNDDVTEVSEEEADYCASNAFETGFVKTDEIANFILEKNKNNPIKKTSN
jgi:hypothetical protein